MEEVVSLIGAPDRIVRGNDREIFHYYYYDGKSPAMLLLILNFIRMDIKSDNLYVFFNRNGIAEEVVYGKRTDRTQFNCGPLVTNVAARFHSIRLIVGTLCILLPLCWMYRPPSQSLTTS